MASVNKAILVGFLGKDPETRYMPDGKAVTNISVATSESWTDKSSGEKKENTEWHRVSFFGRIAEIAGEFLKKGSMVFIEGKIQTRKWQDKEGKERYTTEIVAHEMKMLNWKRDGEAERSEPAKAPTAIVQPKTGGGTFSDMSDDIPFISCQQDCTLRKLFVGHE